MAYPSDIGPALVAARRSCRMPQRVLGERIGVAQQQIARWEATGYRTASLERVDEIARVLGQPVRVVALPDSSAEGVSGGRVGVATDRATLVPRLLEICDTLRAELEGARIASGGGEGR